MIYENTFFFDLYPCALTHTFFTRVDLLLTVTLHPKIFNTRLFHYLRHGNKIIHMYRSKLYVITNY